MSTTLTKMYNEKLGFRTENFSGSGIRNLEDVVYFEIKELGNTDILDTMNKLYGIDFYPYMDIEDNFSVADESYRDVIELIYSHCEKQFNTTRNNLGAIWLTTYDNVEKIYCNQPTDKINMIYIYHNFYPISDLDSDGTLFVYKKEDCPYI